MKILHNAKANYPTLQRVPMRFFGIRFLLILSFIVPMRLTSNGQKNLFDEFGVHVISDSVEIANVRLMHPIRVSFEERLIKNDPETHRTFEADLLSVDSIRHTTAISKFSDLQLLRSFTSHEIELLYRFARMPMWGLDRAYALFAIPSLDPIHSFQFLKEMIEKADLSPSETIFAYHGICMTPSEPSTIDFLIDRFDSLRRKQGTGSNTEVCEEILETMICIHLQANQDDRLRIEQLILKELARRRHVNISIYEMEEAFLKNPSAITLPYFLDRSKDATAHAGDYLIAIARLQGSEAQPLLLPYLRNPQVAYQAISAVSFAWADDLQAAKQVLLAIGMADSSGFEDPYILEEAWEMGGPQFAQELLSALPKRTRTNYFVYDCNEVFGEMTPTHPWVLQSQNLYALGLLKKPLTVEAIDTMRHAMIATRQFDFGRQLYQIIPQHFSWKYDGNNSDNNLINKLLQQFLSLSNGKLKGLEFFSEFESGNYNVKSDQSWMIFQGKCYRMKRFPSMKLSSQIEILLNQILLDLGFQEQFMPINMSGIEENYLFCRKEIAWQAIDLLKLEKSWPNR